MPEWKMEILNKLKQLEKGGGIIKSGYVLAIDVAKGKSMFYIQSIHGEVLLSPIEYEHNLKSLKTIEQIIEEEEIKKEITVFLESTSSYHYPVERYFIENNYKVLTVNPNIVKKSKTDLRRTKTDALDCVLLANCFFKETFKSNSVKTYDIYDSLRTLNRQYLAYEKTLTALKNRYVRLLDICIPCHGDIMASSNGNSDTSKKYSNKYLNLFYQYPHLDLILSTRVDKLANVLNESFNMNYKKRLTKEAISIKEKCSDSYPGVSSTHTEVDNLRQVIETIIHLKKIQSVITIDLVKLSKIIEFQENIYSIPGIGELTTAQIIAEIGNIDRFNTYKQLTAYLGLDPVLRQSGKSVYYV